MKAKMNLVTGVGAVIAVMLFGASAVAAERRLSLEDYRDKMKGAWIGQMVGVSWGQPTEFKFSDKIMPAESVPKWTRERINIDTFGNDDLYVEMTFLKTLEDHGISATSRQAGIDFANTRYGLWAANLAGRMNLRKGIAPPESSHPAFNDRCNDIDYQIESDFAGIISPGCPQEAIRLGNVFGRLMNSGDGVWAGQFIGAMYCEAFFTADVDRLLDAGLAAIPSESDYAQMVRDVRAWEREFPDDWTKAWERIHAKWSKSRNASIRDANGGIDVRLNGACIILGLVYGKSDLDRSMELAMRCGWDSDCNPSNVGGILMCARGAKNLDDKYGFAIIDTKTKFAFTDYAIPDVFRVCEKLARDVVVKNGGRVERDAAGREWFVIPEQKPEPDVFEPTWKAAPPKGLRYTAEEMRGQKFAFKLADAAKLSDPDPTRRVQKTLEALYPGWTTTENGEAVRGERTGYIECIHIPWSEAYEVLCTHPPRAGVPVVLSRDVSVPTGDAKLVFSVANKVDGKWRLRVVVDGTELMATEVSYHPHVREVVMRRYSLSLAPWAGKRVKIELFNESSGAGDASALWHDIRLTSNNGSLE